MDWFTVIVIWLVAPVVEGAVIIVLLADRSRKKKKNRQPGGVEGRGIQNGGRWEAPDESRLRTISVRPYPAPKEKPAGCLVSDIRDNLGTVSLVIGAVLVVLAGMIFATTRWQVLSELHKVLLVFGAALLFFAVSHIAEKTLHIHRTGNAFYILGSIFLFLTVMAASYFRFLGPGFVLEDGGQWKVCWIGSMVTETAFLAGLKRFHDRSYTQASLWGLALGVCFMAKALGAGWNGLTGSAAWLGVGLVMGYRYMASRQFSGEKRWLAVVKEELAGFLQVYFAVFCAVLAFLWIGKLGYSAAPFGRMAADGAFAYRFLIWMAELFFGGDWGLGCGLLCIGLAAVLAVVSLYVSRLPAPGGKPRGTGMEQAGIYSLAGVYALSGMLCGQDGSRIFAVSLWFMAVQAFVLFGKRKTEGFGQEKGADVLWEFCGFATLTAGIFRSDGDRMWVFGYLLLFALYCLRFVWIRRLKKGAGFLASCFLAAAVWEQPFICWPGEIALEAMLFPAAMLIWIQGLIWERTVIVKRLQSIGYICCLMVLTADALRTGLLADALMLEIICLAAFFRAQAAKDACWVRISGAFILLVALLMTREFWLSISWWVYLLAAGIGLIVFAAINEGGKRRR